MIEPGDLYVAHLNEDRHRQVLVASPSRFNRLAGRALVVPEVFGGPDEVAFPWRVESEGRVFAVDHVRTLAVERLVERAGRAPSATLDRVRRVLHQLS